MDPSDDRNRGLRIRLFVAATLVLAWVIFGILSMSVNGGTRLTLSGVSGLCLFIAIVLMLVTAGQWAFRRRDE